MVAVHFLNTKRPKEQQWHRANLIAECHDPDAILVKLADGSELWVWPHEIRPMEKLVDRILQEMIHDV